MLENAKVHILRNKKIYGASLALVVLLSLASFAYKDGYRLKSNLTVGKLGKLHMILPLANTNIFIDASEKITTKTENEEVNIPFSPTKHSIIISRSGYFPWKKDFIIQSNETLTLRPIFVTQNTTGEIITKNDPDYYKIRNSIIAHVLPTKNSPETSEDKSATLWLEDNAIMVKIGETTKKIIQPDTVIRSAHFYKDRSDAVMFSTYGSIFVIEVDEVGNQNFMPLFVGQKPVFLKKDSNSIYVLDGENLMEVVT